MAFNFNSATARQAAEMALDKVVVKGAAVTSPSASGFNQLSTGWDSAVDGVLSTGSAINGAITIGRAGHAQLEVSGSFESDAGGSTDVKIAIYKNGSLVDTPVTRTITAVGFGSFDASASVDCVSGDVCAVYVDNINKALTFDSIAFDLEWQA